MIDELMKAVDLYLMQRVVLRMDGDLARKELRAALEDALKPGEQLPALFREALSWGMTFGPMIPTHQWDEMRDGKVEQLVQRAAPPAQTPPPATSDLLRVQLRDDWRTDDWGVPIIYDTDEVDELTARLTGDEGEDESLTVLRSMAAYVQNVWPGKTAMQVLTECEESTLSAPPAQTDTEDSIGRDAWIESAMRVYKAAGDSEEIALGCAAYLWGELDMLDIPCPYDAALSDVEGRGLFGAPD